MSERRDLKHFDDYTPQNKAKHEILTSYYKPYLQILKGHAQRFHFIDAFAGPGQYANSNPGSPLLALNVMAEVGILGRSTISCVENQPEFAEQLTLNLTTSPHKASLLQPVTVHNGAFHTFVDEILGRSIYTVPGKTATFAFVDPCGVSGVRLKDLTRLLKLDFGEVLLLFNSDGVNRLLGGIDQGTHDNRILIDLFGTEERLELVRRRIQKKPSERELVILEEFTAALKADSGAGYFLRFRFKAKDSDRSSHYLIHCSNNPLAFKLMKNVMWTVGKSDQDPYGRLEFLSDHERGTSLDLFRVDLEGPKTEILARLRKGHCRVSEITDAWVCRPADNFSDKVYKQLLIDLERNGQILVYDKQNLMPKPAAQRKPRLGKPTLADDYWLRQTDSPTSSATRPSTPTRTPPPAPA